MARARRVDAPDPGARGRARPARWRRLRHGATRLSGAQQSLRAAVALRLPRQRRGPPYAVGLYEWAVEQGLPLGRPRMPDRHRGRPILPTDYLPRRLMGEYLAWFYDTLLADAPPNLEVVRHYAAAVDIIAGDRRPRGGAARQRQTISVDHVVLTSGHTWNDEPVGGAPDVRYLRPYPVEYFDDPAAPGSAGRHRRHGPGRLRPPHRAHRRAGRDLRGRGRPQALRAERAASRSSTSTRARASPTAPSRPTASIPTATTSRWCARPRSSPS